MMGRQSGQISMLVLDMEELIPENHLLRRINQLVSFNFIYDLAAPYYSANGRPSVDPVSMFKMLLVGYLYGIKSKRRLAQEVQLNIAYRWFAVSSSEKRCQIILRSVKQEFVNGMKATFSSRFSLRLFVAV